MATGISLANKCQLLFGLAVVAILAVALSVPWLRIGTLVEEYEREFARREARQFLSDPDNLLNPDPVAAEIDNDVRFRIVRAGEFESARSQDPFIAAAIVRFEDAEVNEHFGAGRYDDEAIDRYARAIRSGEWERFTNSAADGPPKDSGAADPLVAVLIVDRPAGFAARQLLLNRVYIIAAGVVGGLGSVLVFYFILTKLILSPVRLLRETTEKVQTGNLSLRSQIKTGDEFEQLSEAFNAMLERVERSQAQLKSLNATLDLKINQLAEDNVGLYESNRLKSEFLANVSHELRTPLNSIIGFTELLEELARSDPAADPKRMRYLENILSSGHSLLEMINELLNMAKIEAGRMEVNIEPTSVTDLVEGLTNVMRPQAEAKKVELRFQAATNLPIIETDPGKLQQIMYNFLSNALKFTPAGGVVTITADRVMRQDSVQGVRLGVSDTGPGIPYDLQEVIFEKFRQADASHTREHPGTGLGLAICRELAEMLGAAVSLVSEPGRGATFFVDLPLAHQPEKPQPLMA